VKLFGEEIPTLADATEKPCPKCGNQRKDAYLHCSYGWYSFEIIEVKCRRCDHTEAALPLDFVEPPPAPPAPVQQRADVPQSPEKLTFWRRLRMKLA
jgi:hypothetical protein